ncbi:helix-turn-helix domain-containing protein [Magnetospirillum sp. 15-1]|uniref:helix-turn-helix domain-containing protein n=1 Tax=Magnetospirillum sp. 15-1 TaxID=1979370 RepID=UPI000BBBAA34|nr:helix-turn-helix domain-containing protein [Magnetospirillum sp. 15-1]
MMTGTFFEAMPLADKADWLKGVLADEAIKDACQRRTGDGVSHPVVKTVAAVIALVRHNTKDGRCFPGFETIGKDCGIHKNMVRRAVEVLKECQWIETGHLPGLRTTLRYRLKFPERDTSPGVTATPPEVLRDTSEGVAVTPPKVSEHMKLNREEGTGEGTHENTSIDGAVGGCAALTVSFGGLSPSSSPVGNEGLTGEEGRKEEATGLRENSAAPVPPLLAAFMNNLTERITAWMIDAYKPKDLHMLRDDFLDPGRREWALGIHGITVKGEGLAFYDGVFDDAVRATLERNGPTILAGLPPENGRVGARDGGIGEPPIDPLEARLLAMVE